MSFTIDAHHHIWREADLPWLQGPMQPRIFGAYEPICRDYPISEYLADLAGTGVARSVYVQTNWSPGNFADEVAWVEGVAATTGWPHAIVGYADLTSDDVRPQLDRLQRYPLMRGLRMQLHWHQNPQYRFAARPDLVIDPTVVRNIGRLADYGWSFELQVFAGQMADAARLAEACPAVTFVLQHAGMPADLSDAGRSAWRRGIVRLAAQPNVVVKLSGLGTFIHRNEPAHVERICKEALELFGAQRCLFGSNFPIEKLWTSYRELIATFEAALHWLSAADRQAVLEATARRVYRIAS